MKAPFTTSAVCRHVDQSSSRLLTTMPSTEGTLRDHAPAAFDDDRRRPRSVEYLQSRASSATVFFAQASSTMSLPSPAPVISAAVAALLSSLGSPFETRWSRTALSGANKTVARSKRGATCFTRPEELRVARSTCASGYQDLREPRSHFSRQLWPDTWRRPSSSQPNLSAPAVCSAPSAKTAGRRRRLLAVTAARRTVWAAR